GAILNVLARVQLPRGPNHGFDERTWLRRHGVHVVLRVDEWHQVGRRRGAGGVGDRLHGWLARDSAYRLRGERRAIVDAIVLGDAHDLDAGLLQRFQASGLYHVFDAGFQLSFAAVASIFVVAPRVSRRLEGYPVPRSVGQLIGVSTACGLATAPVTWFQFQQISLVTVPANVVGVPVVAEMLG